MDTSDDVKESMENVFLMLFFKLIEVLKFNYINISIKNN